MIPAPTSPSAAELAERVLALAAANPDRRVLVGIAGSPGAGKSTVAAAVVGRLNELREAAAVHVPMDGFHLASSTLHRLGAADRKGAIDTFDGWGFLALLDRIRHERGHTVYAPGFDRRIEEPVAAQIAVEPETRFVVVEGNYLLVRAEPWGGVRARLDEAWFCEAPEPERMRRLVERHVAGGRNPDAARAWARDVDGANAAMIAPTRESADLIVCCGESGAG
ncbi:nucleoside/nucleotide kinase family protein [Rathayibacter sp. YIM 133350]|uniref:nucleoside/nucleotide kinase family protein n=1 Tax=Rathayibacter sp. YIM 133350 TaxID=3131992 RepID=UPI00307E3FBC